MSNNLYIVVHEWKWSWLKFRYIPKIISFETDETQNSLKVDQS